MTYLEKAVKAYKENLEKVQKIMDEADDPVVALEKLVSISEGNTKTGKSPSVSLLPRMTCPWSRCECTCGEKCYAIKIANLRPTVLEAYARNTAVLHLCPTAFFVAVEKAVKRSAFFRFHIAGDIPSRDYLLQMHRIARSHPNCKILCFTKQYELVNDYMDKIQKPDNLQILFSGWTNLKPKNPYNLPETTVYAKDEDFRPEWKACGGNCLDCAIHNGGCWTAKNGETVAFRIH